MKELQLASLLVTTRGKTLYETVRKAQGMSTLPLTLLPDSAALLLPDSAALLLPDCVVLFEHHEANR